MLIKQEEQGINLYRRYLDANRQKRQVGKRRTVLLAVPPLVLLGIFLVTAGILLLGNVGRRAQLTQLEAQIETLRPAYREALELSQTEQALTEEYSQIFLSTVAFRAYPALTEQILQRVRACGKDIFSITNYSYDETDATLTIQANAASVNEVPGLVERLRDTSLFSAVQYTGYTSEDARQYYCTVRCTLLYEDAAESE